MPKAILIFITFWLAASSAFAAQLDAFLIIGQSNAVGFAVDTSAFVNAYQRVTGHSVLMIPAAVGGTAILPSSPEPPSNSWAPNGDLFEASIARAFEAVAEAGPIARIGIIFAQGETDARQIARGEATGAYYEAALHQLIDRYRIIFGPTLPFYIIRTGRYQTLQFETGMEAVRTAQERVAAADGPTWIVYRHTVLFPARGWMRDEVHYSPRGLEDIRMRAGVYIGCLVMRPDHQCRL